MAQIASILRVHLKSRGVCPILRCGMNLNLEGDCYLYQDEKDDSTSAVCSCGDGSYAAGCLRQCAELAHEDDASFRPGGYKDQLDAEGHFAHSSGNVSIEE